VNYKQLNGISIREGFEDFHKANPHIFEAFADQVFQALKQGKKKVSAKMILNVIRWNQYLKTNDLSFKINDAYQAYYSRLFVQKYPQYSDVFDFRKLRNEEQEPYMRIEDNGQLAFL
jgi:hypothetical protein